MFSKKNKQALPPEMQTPAPMASGLGPAVARTGGQSVFAPGLNPLPSRIDFGLNQDFSALPPLESHTESYAMPSEPMPPQPAGGDFEPEPQPLQWEPTMPPLPASITDVPAWEPPPPGSIAPATVDDWQPSPSDSVLPADTWSVATPEAIQPVPEPQPYVPPQQPALPPAPALDVLPPLAPQPVPPSLLAPIETLAPSSPPTAAEASYLHAEAAPVSAEEMLWQNLALPEAVPPGEQVPMAPAAFLDSVNQQLYPEDPFLDPMNAEQGEQAFEEAARFLFPETLSAPLEWQEEVPASGSLGTEPLSPSAPSALPFEPVTEQTAPLELGPSFLADPAGAFDDLSAIYSDAPLPDPFGELRSETISELYPPGEAPGDVWPAQEPQPPSVESPLEMAPDDDVNLSSWAEPEALTMEPAAGFEAPAFDVSGLDYSVPDAMSDSVSDFGMASYSLDEPEEVASEYVLEPSATPDAQSGFDAMVTPYSLDESDNTVLEYTLDTPMDSFLDSADDAFQITPVAPFEMNTEVDSSFYGAQDTFAPAAYEIQQDVQPADAPQEQEEAPAYYSFDAAADTPASVVSGEDAWSLAPTDFAQQPEESMTPASNVAPAASTDAQSAISLGNLEILGTCPLDEEKRLLVVQNKGIFALMAQVGLESPKVTVLKIFDHNPIAYQQTFTAVREGQAGDQGMYVTQVGTWHAIVSTFQDTISLHTELG